MASVASRDLRNHTREVLDRVQRGETIQITVHGEVVAEVKPVASRKPRHGNTHELIALLQKNGYDHNLKKLLDEMKEQDLEYWDEDPWTK